LIVTDDPTGPLKGLILVITGGGMIVICEDVAVPPRVTTSIDEVTAPTGTVALIWVALSTVKEAELVPNFTLVVLVKLVPVIVTTTPTAPIGGVTLKIVGAGITVNCELLVAEPPGVTTSIFEVAALAGTVALICVALLRVKDAKTEPNLTLVAPVKLLPLTVTVAPIAPLAGVKLEITGAGITVNSDELVSEPPSVTTSILEVAALSGTVAVICVALTTL